MTLAARFEEWAHQHKEEGRKEGIEKGEGRLLQRQLVHRFGPLPHHVLAQLENASAPQIESWSDRLMDGFSLAEIFAG